MLPVSSAAAKPPAAVQPAPAPVRRRSTLDEKKDRRPELINSVPRFYQFDNDRLVSQAYAALIKAQSCWLTAPEILALLEFSKECSLGAQTPHRPPSGSVFFYDSRSGVCFRRDGYSYIKKKGSAISVREDHVKLRIGNVAVIYASYVHSSEHHTPAADQTSLFHRRSYWLVNSQEKERGVIVHYLSSGEGSAQIEPSLPHNLERCECMLCSLRRVHVPQGLEHRALDRILERCPAQQQQQQPATASVYGQQQQYEGEDHPFHGGGMMMPLTPPHPSSSSSGAASASASGGRGDVFMLDAQQHGAAVDFDPYDPDELLLMDDQHQHARRPPAAVVVVAAPVALAAPSPSPPPPYHHHSYPPPLPPSSSSSSSFMQPFKPPQPAASSQLPPLPPPHPHLTPLPHPPPVLKKQSSTASASTADGKPQVRFDAANLHIAEFAPQVVRRAGQRVLLNLGMRKHPESLNYRTWTEKVMPRLVIKIAWSNNGGGGGEDVYTAVNVVESVSLGVVRFHCPPPLQSSEEAGGGDGEIRVWFDLGGNRGLLRLDYAATLRHALRFHLSPSSTAPSYDDDMEEEEDEEHHQPASAGLDYEEEEEEEDGYYAPPPPHTSSSSPTPSPTPSNASSSPSSPCPTANNNMDELDLDRKATVMVERVVRELLKSSAASGSTALILDEVSPENGFNFLHTVVFCQASLEVVDLLLRHGASVNLRTTCPQGNTALHMAVEHGSVDCARLLLQHGADATLANAHGQCPPDLAETGQMMQLFASRAPTTAATTMKRVRTNSVSSTGSTSTSSSSARHMQMLRHSLGALSVSDQATLAMAVDHRKNSSCELEEYLTAAASSPQLMPSAAAASSPSAVVVHEEDADVDRLVTEAQPQIYAMMRNTMTAHELASINHEAIKIQSNVRAWILRKKFGETQDAATKIQALAKGHLARKDFRELKDKVTHTLVIQKCYRRHREQQQALASAATAAASHDLDDTLPLAREGDVAASAVMVETEEEDEELAVPPELFLSLD